MKSKKLWILGIVIILTNTKTMAQKTFSIEIQLKASKQAVWNVLVDFPSYESWNSVLKMKNNDSLEVGRKFDVTITNQKGKTSSFKAKTLTNEAPNAFSARQKIIGKWLFSATHHFILEEHDNGETTFIQTWEFTGILFRLFKKVIFRDLEHFNQMNQDLSVKLQ